MHARLAPGCVTRDAKLADDRITKPAAFTLTFQISPVEVTVAIFILQAAPLKHHVQGIVEANFYANGTANTCRECGDRDKNTSGLENRNVKLLDVFYSPSFRALVMAIIIVGLLQPCFEF